MSNPKSVDEYCPHSYFAAQGCPTCPEVEALKLRVRELSGRIFNEASNTDDDLEAADKWLHMNGHYRSPREYTHSVLISIFLAGAKFGEAKVMNKLIKLASKDCYCMEDGMCDGCAGDYVLRRIQSGIK